MSNILRIIIGTIIASPFLGIALGFIIYSLISVFFNVILTSYYAIEYLYNNSHTYTIIGIIWFLLIVATKFIQRLHYVGHLYTPIQRTILHRCINFFFVYATIGITTILLINWTNIIEPISTPTNLEEIAFHHIVFKNKIKSGLILMIILNFHILILNKYEKAYYVTIPKIKYNLFLRSFNMDENISIDKEIKSNFSNELIEIANPFTYRNHSFSGKDFFLPTKSWKRELSYYIRKANFVFCYIGNSDGIIWEMFKNNQDAEKFIYYLSNDISLNTIITKARKEYHNSRMYQIFRQLIKIEKKSPFYFIIRNNICYYSKKLHPISLFINKGQTHYGLKYFKLNAKKTVNKEVRVPFFYYIKDFQRIFSIIFRPATFGKIAFAIAAVVIHTLHTISYLAGIFLILWGIVTMSSTIFPSLEIFVPENSMLNKFGLGIICIASGLVWIYITREHLKEQKARINPK